MPELPEVETVRRGLALALPGCRIERVELRRADLRLPFSPNMRGRLEGRRWTAIERRSKYLLMHTVGPDVLLAHLGMTGTFLLRPEGDHPAQPHQHVRIALDDGRELIYRDPRRFGLILLVPQAELAVHPLLASLGPEPLEEGFCPDYLAERLARRSGPIKSALMDAKLVVGVGNIYASEALFRVGIHPLTPACACVEKALLLVEAVRDVLREAIDSGGSTLRDYSGATGSAGYFQHRFKVYGRAGRPCERCAGPVENITIGGRSSFFCSRCQPLHSLKLRNRTR